MRTRSALVAVTVFLVLTGAAIAQDQQTARLQAFQSNFGGANLQTKLEILRTAEAEDPVAFGPLYGQALSHVVSNANRLGTEPMLREVALIAVERIHAGRFTPALNDLWRYFSVYEESSARISVARVLGDLGAGDAQTVRFLNAWVRARNDVMRAGGAIDMQVLTAVVEALGKIGDSTSFDALIETIILRYPNFVTDTALASVRSLDGDRLELAVRALNTFPPAQRLEMVQYFARSDLFDSDGLMRYMHAALINALTYSSRSRDETEIMRSVRHFAAGQLAAGEFGNATREIIRHFNESVLEFDRGLTSKDRVLEAIAFLGRMGTAAAATRLTDYLELVNTYTEIDRPYDVQILLAVIENLRLLRQPASYNALFYTTMLEKYPSRVRDAARAAMQVLMQ